MTTPRTRPLKGGFTIGVTCPGCGSELELQDNFFVLTCEHCASVLRIVMPDIPPAYLVPFKKNSREAIFLLERYCKENGIPLPQRQINPQQIFVPYWKIDAVALKVRHTVYEVEYGDEEDGFSQRETEEKELTSINLVPFSATIAAVNASQGIPYSIGMRVDYIKMIPYSEESAPPEIPCLPVAVTQQIALQNANKGATEIGKMTSDGNRKNLTELYGLTSSLVNFPLFLFEDDTQTQMRIFVSDGVTGKVLSQSSGHQTFSQIIPEHQESSQYGTLNVKLHRCSNCGVDLPSAKSFVYKCHNCHRIEFLEKHQLLKKEVKLTGQRGNNADTFFPFWAFQFPENDCSALKRIFGGVFGSNQLLIPAFKTKNFEVVFKLCKRISAASAKMNFANLDDFTGQFSPVSLSFHEALTLVEIMWRREAVSRVESGKQSSGFTPVSATLVYAPFHPEQYFFVDSVIKAVTFEKGILL